MEKIVTKEVLGALIVITISILIYNICKKITKSIIRKRSKQGEERKSKTLMILFTNIFKYLIIIIDIIILLELFGINTKTIVTSLGAISVVVGLAIQDVLKDIIAGLFLIFESQYRLGDYVRIGDFTGEVIVAGLKTTRIKSSTGEVKIISNRFITEVINLSMENSLAIMDIEVAYDSDLLLVERVLKDVCKDITSSFKTIKGKADLVGIQALNKGGVTFRITATTLPMAQYEVEREMRKKAKIALQFNKIKFPQNQVVVNNG
jgi:Small-conductance mechanosensitive channel